MTYQTNLTVLRGLPITVEYEIQAPDRSVGIFHSEVTWCIVAVAGKPAKNTNWLYKRIVNAGEAEEIDAKCFDDQAERIRENYCVHCED